MIELKFWADNTLPAPTVAMEFPDRKDPFDILARAMAKVDAASGNKKPMDARRATPENARTSSPKSQQAIPPERSSSTSSSPESVMTPGGSRPSDLFSPAEDAQPASGSGASRQLVGASERVVAGSNPAGRATKSGVRLTSIIHYRALRFSGKMSDQQSKILGFFLKNPRAKWTRREIAHQTGIDLSAVCGRVNELMNMAPPLLVEDGKKGCCVTGNVVNALALAVDDSPTEGGK